MDTFAVLEFLLSFIAKSNSILVYIRKTLMKCPDNKWTAVKILSVSLLEKSN